jgi:hypothetical protein
MNKELELLLSKDWKRRIITSIKKILITPMNFRKITIGLTILLLLFITVYPNEKGENKKISKVNFLLYTGISFIPYNTSDTFKPAVNIGCGFGYCLSKSISLVFYLRHYLFFPKHKYCWFMWWGDSPIPVKLEEPFYMGDMTYEFYDFLLNVKLKHKKLTDRLNFYSVAGAGLSYRIEASGWSIGINGRQLYYSKSLFCLVSAGLGLEFDLNRNIDIFLEGSYNYCFLSYKEKNTGVIPVKIGFAWKF